jgi:hypothetical protein
MQHNLERRSTCQICTHWIRPGLVHRFGPVIQLGIRSMLSERRWDTLHHLSRWPVSNTPCISASGIECALVDFVGHLLFRPSTSSHHNPNNQPTPAELCSGNKCEIDELAIRQAKHERSVLNFLLVLLSTWWDVTTQAADWPNFHYSPLLSEVTKLNPAWCCTAAAVDKRQPRI